MHRPFIPLKVKKVTIKIIIKKVPFATIIIAGVVVEIND